MIGGAESPASPTPTPGEATFEKLKDLITVQWRRHEEGQGNKGARNQEIPRAPPQKGVPIRELHQTTRITQHVLRQHANSYHKHDTNHTRPAQNGVDFDKTANVGYPTMPCMGRWRANGRATTPRQTRLREYYRDGTVQRNSD